MMHLFKPTQCTEVSMDIYRLKLNVASGREPRCWKGRGRWESYTFYSIVLCLSKVGGAGCFPKQRMTHINRMSTSYIEMKDAFIWVQSSGMLARVGEACSWYSSMQTGSFFHSSRPWVFLYPERSQSLLLLSSALCSRILILENGRHVNSEVAPGTTNIAAFLSQGWKYPDKKMTWHKPGGLSWLPVKGTGLHCRKARQRSQQRLTLHPISRGWRQAVLCSFSPHPKDGVVCSGCLPTHRNYRSQDKLCRQCFKPIS